jgi:hypothetical protein
MTAEGGATSKKSGFRKGFLLSNNKKKKNGGAPTKKKTASSALLDLEGDESTPSSLLFVSQQQQDNNRVDETPSTGPLIINNDDDNDDNFGIQEVWSSKPSFISPVVEKSRRRSTEEQPPEKSSRVLAQAQDNNLIQRRQQQSEETASSSMIQEEHLIQRRQQQQQQQQQPQDKNAPPLIQEEEQQEPLPPNPNLLLVISKELSKTLLRRNHYQSFVSTYLTSPEAWLTAWPLVLPRIQKDAMELGTAMIIQEGGASTFVHVTQQSSQTKTVLLGAALLLTDLIRTNRTLPEATNQLVPTFVKIVQDSKRRTVLGHESMVACYGLLLSIDCNNRPAFDILREVQEQWLFQKSDSWRRQCTLTMIRNWKTVKSDGMSGLGRHDDFGGIRQTLFHTPKLDADKILAVLTEAKSSPARRTILRGVLAVFGQDKTLWRQEFIHDVVAKLLPILILDDANSESDNICSSLLVFLLQASPPDQPSEYVTMIIDCLQDQPDKAPRIGQPWSKSLLESTLVDQERYAVVLESVCKAMFHAPDQMAPLALFGSLVDININSLDRINKGVLTVMSTCNQRMESHHDDMYQRLAPLLLLRRIPSTVYHAIWQERELLSHELQHVATTLTTQLAKILNDVSTDISPSERKVAAEIAGRCLPFDLDAPYSTFTVILLPAFQNLACAIQSGNDEKTSPYRPAKAALYAACCQVPLANDAPAIWAVASFALWLLQLHNEDDALVECQRGCIEFFATCLKTNVSKIATGLQQVLANETDSIDRFETKLFGISLAAKGLESPSVKTCVWNAYLLVSQRTPEVIDWANRTGPWVLDWIDNQATTEPTAAAALQILFVLITRTKSLVCVDNQLQRVNRCIRQCLRREDARLAALKLLLAVITLDVDRYQGLGDEAEETLTLVASVAQRDDAFRELAKHLLG